MSFLAESINKPIFPSALRNLVCVSRNSVGFLYPNGQSMTCDPAIVQGLEQKYKIDDASLVLAERGSCGFGANGI
jgi:hypothetical protein